MSEFKQFLLKEDQNYLVSQIGDILSALQSVDGDGDNLGNRQIIKAVQNIVNQIKRILHDKWDDSYNDLLKALQKCGVALMKGIDGTEDLRQNVSSVTQFLQAKTSKTGEPINDIGNN